MNTKGNYRANEFRIRTDFHPFDLHGWTGFCRPQLKDSKFDRHLASLCPHQRNRGRIPDGDIARTMIGLICVGKPHFDAVTEFAGDRFFPQALGVRQLPSTAILRQRIQGMPQKAGDAFRDFTTRLLRDHNELLVEARHGQQYMAVNIDVSPMDNSGSHKESVSCTYKKFDGYAPIFAYVGPHGFMLNNPLRPGSSHCNSEGTKDWLEQTLKRAKAVAPEDTRRLVITDAGHDAAENLALFEQAPQTDFLVKRNLRRSDPSQWLSAAQHQTDTPDELDCGARAWYGERIETIRVESEDSDEEKQISLRVVWRATERLAEPDGQLLTEPEITIEAWWTSLDWSPEAIQDFYQQRGTSEQFHSELKTDLDLERLPSGKLAANQHILDLGMMAYNVLRLLGQQMLASGQVPGRKADSRRLRLRTVLNSLIYMAGRMVTPDDTSFGSSKATVGPRSR